MQELDETGEVALLVVVHREMASIRAMQVAAHLTDTVEFEQRIGALPGLVESSFELADALDARLWHRIGFDYLRALLAAPGQEISALDLTANGPGLVATTAEPVLDNQARVTFRRQSRRVAPGHRARRSVPTADRTNDTLAALRRYPWS